MKFQNLVQEHYFKVPNELTEKLLEVQQLNIKKVQHLKIRILVNKHKIETKIIYQTGNECTQRSMNKLLHNMYNQNSGLVLPDAIKTDGCEWQLAERSPH